MLPLISMPHSLTDDHIDILRFAKGGASAPGPAEMPRPEDAKYLVGLGYLELQQGRPVITTAGVHCLEVVEEAWRAHFERERQRYLR